MPSTRLVLRGANDIAQLGSFLRDARRAAGFASASEAAPLLNVTPRLLAEVERGMRIKRGVSLGALLGMLAGLGYEVEIRKRGQGTGTSAPSDAQ